IFHSTKPAVLVIFDGQPVWSQIPDVDLKFAVNTNWDVFRTRHRRRVIHNGNIYRKSKLSELSLKRIGWSPGCRRLPVRRRRVRRTEVVRDHPRMAIERFDNRVIHRLDNLRYIFREGRRIYVYQQSAPSRILIGYLFCSVIGLNRRGAGQDSWRPQLIGWAGVFNLEAKPPGTRDAGESRRRAREPH